MGFLTTRVVAVSDYLAERVRHGLPAEDFHVSGHAVLVIDGVGGFQFAPALVQRALRLEGSSRNILMFRWQTAVVGDIWTDLCWHRRNRLMAARLARGLRAWRRRNPHGRLDVVAFSAGAAIAVFACEQLRGRPFVETMVLACPALSRKYNLGPALRAVRRCIALISRRDRFLLGAGTRLFGTVDRRFEPAAGLRGFALPDAVPPEDRAAYARLREIWWDPSLHVLGHHGGHTGWGRVSFLRKHLLAMLDGAPHLPTHPVFGLEPAHDASRDET